MENMMEYLLKAYKELKAPNSKLKVHPLDDRMMEDGTINPNHYTLKDGYMSDAEFNRRQTGGSFG